MVHFLPQLLHLRVQLCIVGTELGNAAVNNICQPLVLSLHTRILLQNVVDGHETERFSSASCRFPKNGRLFLPTSLLLRVTSVKVGVSKDEGEVLVALVELVAYLGVDLASEPRFVLWFSLIPISSSH